MKKSFILLIAFALFFVCWRRGLLIHLVSGWLPDSTSLYYLVSYGLSGIFPLIALFMIHNKRNILYSLGLSKRMLTGWGMSLCATLPMFIGFALLGSFYKDISIDNLCYSIFIAGFFEELIYRGFVFGQLLRYAKWGFIPAVLISALPFGLLHIYQGHDLLSSLAAFGITALGGVFFAWLYVEWNYNLWCSIGMHTLMNMSWILFKVSPGAAGDIGGNLIRILTIVVAIMLTVIYKKKNHLGWQVTSKTLWVKQS